MGKITIFIFLVFLAVLGFFALENKDTVTLKIPFGEVYIMSKVALLLLATTAGALGVLFIFFIRDTRNVIENLHFQKRQKRDERINLHYTRALNAIFSSNKDEAKESLEAVLKEDPGHFDALRRLGDLNMENHEYLAAKEFYDQAKEVNPKSPVALLSLANVMEKMRRYTEALKYADEVLDRDSDNLVAMQKKRSIFEQSSRWDELISLQKVIIKQAQADRSRLAAEEEMLTGYQYEYARASLESNEIEKAEKMFRTILKTSPDFVPAYLGLVEVLLLKNENEEAINTLEKAFDQIGSIILLARLEDLLISLGEPGRLIRFYKNNLSRKPMDNRLKFLLAKFYYRVEMIDDALDMINSVDTGMLSTPEFYSLRGELYLKRNQMTTALNDFRRASEFRKNLRLPYCCSSCESMYSEWTGRCQTCKKWNTLKLDVYGSCKE
ncbi:MAG: tetratricopeptide repeat protein [Dissulfurispiraceae bacterium]|jgi:predicted Zn-dependent protease|nr:tetratricopeptide repeat protein [Dissulfurispiraceae bacterium]